MMFGDQLDEITIAIEVQEEFQALKVADRRRIEEIRDVISAIEKKVNVFRRSREDTWDLISEKLTFEIDIASATLTERVAEVKRVVQTRSASPATTVEQNLPVHSEALTQTTMTGLWELPSVVPKKQLGSERKMPWNLRL